MGICASIFKEKKVKPVEITDVCLITDKEREARNLEEKNEKAFLKNNNVEKQEEFTRKQEKAFLNNNDVEIVTAEECIFYLRREFKEFIAILEDISYEGNLLSDCKKSLAKIDEELQVKILKDETVKNIEEDLDLKIAKNKEKDLENINAKQKEIVEKLGLGQSYLTQTKELATKTGKTLEVVSLLICANKYLPDKEFFMKDEELLKVFNINDNSVGQNQRVVLSRPGFHGCEFPDHILQIFKSNKIRAVLDILENGTNEEVKEYEDFEKQVECRQYLSNGIIVEGTHTGKRQIKKVMVAFKFSHYKVTANGPGHFKGSTDDCEVVEYKGDFQNNVFYHNCDKKPAIFSFDGQYEYIGLFRCGAVHGLGKQILLNKPPERILYQQGIFKDDELWLGIRQSFTNPGYYREIENGKMIGLAKYKTKDEKTNEQSQVGDSTNNQISNQIREPTNNIIEIGDIHDVKGDVSVGNRNIHINVNNNSGINLPNWEKTLFKDCSTNSVLELKNTPKDITKDALYKLFSKFGKIELILQYNTKSEIYFKGHHGAEEARQFIDGDRIGNFVIEANLICSDPHVTKLIKRGIWKKELYELCKLYI